MKLYLSPCWADLFIKAGYPEAMIVRIGPVPSGLVGTSFDRIFIEPSQQTSSKEPQEKPVK